MSCLTSDCPDGSTLTLFVIRPLTENLIKFGKPFGCYCCRRSLNNFTYNRYVIFIMPNTYTQISIQAVFAVEGRENLIANTWRDPLHQYIAGVVRKEATTLAVGGWKDHVHVFFGLPPTLSISNLIQNVKANSSRWIIPGDLHI